MIDPAWIGIGLMFTSSLGLSVGVPIYQSRRNNKGKNGKANAEWKGHVDEGLEQLEKREVECRAEMREDIRDIKEMIGDLHKRVTRSQGAE